MAIQIDQQPTEPQPVSEAIKARLDKLKAYSESPEGLAKAEAQRVKAEQSAAREQAESRRRLVETIASQVGPRFHPDRCSLESYQINSQAQQVVFDRIARLLPNLLQFIAEGRGLIWYGTLGTGKDHLAVSLLYALARSNVSCSWIRGLDLYGRLRDRIDAERGPTEESLLRELTAPGVLCISDPIPSVGDLTPWRTEFLLRLVDRRYNALKSTWVTLNAQSEDDADAKLSSQVFDRLRDGAEIFKCCWHTKRSPNKPV